MSDKREMTNPERLLTMFEAAAEKKVEIDETEVDFFVYLLRQKGIPFTYSFIFHPLPYSDELKQDVFGLRMAGYLTGSSISITKKGKEFVSTKILPEFRDIYENMRTYLPEFRRYDRSTLFDVVYARIV